MNFVFFLVFSWCVLKARTRRQVLALALAGTTAAMLVAPPRVEAQASLIAAIQAVLSVINGIVQTALNSRPRPRSAACRCARTAGGPGRGTRSPPRSRRSGRATGPPMAPCG